MREAFVVEALRTPVGKHGGSLAGVRPDDLAAVPIKAIVERSGIDPATIDDVILGCANQAGEDNRNVARMALLLAGLPIEVPGQTVNRLCGSGLQAAASAAQAIKAGEGETFIAGGVESMTRAPYVMLKSGEPWSRKAPETADTTVGWRFVNPRMKKEWTISLGETAEVVAERYKISRADQDAFAVESQRRAEKALKECVFTDELVPVPLPDGSTFAKDEYPRAGTTVDSVAKLKPAFRKDGTVTAASSSGINDGAAALLVTAAKGGEGRRGAANYILKPSAEEILKELLPLYVQNQVYRALVETAAAEHGARRTAMKNATDAGQDMLTILQRTFNRARQAQITQELAEIVGGAEALKG